MKKILLVAILLLVFIFSMAAHSYNSPTYIFWGHGNNKITSYNYAYKVAMNYFKSQGYTSMKILKTRWYIVYPDFSCAIVVQGVK